MAVQLSLPTSGFEKTGAIYTRRWVIDLILDLVGYTPDRDLQSLTIVEPASGDGAFLDAIVERVQDSCRRHGRELHTTTNSILAFELDKHAVARSQSKLRRTLNPIGLSDTDATRLVTSWIKHSDYLLDTEAHVPADVVVGNPPYIRLEDMSPARAKAYRKRYQTMIGRADLYVAFFEAALRQLKSGGVCAFICSDRWMLNQYGAALRDFVTAGFSVETVIEMHSADVFESEVSAYPAIVVIRRREQGCAVVARADQRAATVSREQITDILRDAAIKPGQVVGTSGFSAAGVSEWFRGTKPWPTFSPARLSLLKYLEAKFPPLEDSETKTRVGIGVASGADGIFLTKSTGLVERDRLLPLALAKDIRSGTLEWSGNYLVNPWSDEGLVNLDDYPGLKTYLESHETLLRRRHVAKANPDRWYRTIDRVEAGLLERDKIYIADIKDKLLPVLDRGRTYPHHNLYFIQSTGWDLEVLGGLLLSEMAQFFIECYGVRMRGGYLRFQAQYLRRIRVPRPEDIDTTSASRLRDAFRLYDRVQATQIANMLYGID